MKKNIFKELYNFEAKANVNLKNEKTLEFSKMYNLGYTKEGHEIELIVNNGWLLLEESLSQMLAERITYFILKKQKPGISPGPDKDDIIVKNKHLVLSD